jgi:hypothetical protein
VDKGCQKMYKTRCELLLAGGSESCMSGLARWWGRFKYPTSSARDCELANMKRAGTERHGLLLLCSAQQDDSDETCIVAFGKQRVSASMISVRISAPAQSV